MPTCVARNCQNRPKPGIQLRKFPKDPARRKAWTAQLQVNLEANWEPTDRSYLCSKHFADDQWEKIDCEGKRKLRWNAIPTIFSCDEPVDKSNRSTGKRSLTESNAEIPVHKTTSSVKHVPAIHRVAAHSDDTLFVTEVQVPAEMLPIPFPCRDCKLMWESRNVNSFEEFVKHMQIHLDQQCTPQNAKSVSSKSKTRSGDVISISEDLIGSLLKNAKDLSDVSTSSNLLCKDINALDKDLVNFLECMPDNKTTSREWKIILKSLFRDERNRIQEVKGSFECGMCQEKLPDITQLSIHMRTHKDISTFPCEECGKLFQTVGSLQLHTNYFHRGGIEKKNSKKPKGYETVTGENNEDVYVCKTCKQTCLTKDKIYRHLNQCARRNLIQSAESRNKGIKIVRGPNNTKLYECKNCKKQYRARTSINFHLNQCTKHPSADLQEDEQSMSDQNEVIPSRGILRFTTEEVAGGLVQYTCKKCGHKLNNKGSMQWHVSKCCPNPVKRSWTGKSKPRKFKCDMCKGCFFNEKLLESHKIKLHGPSPFQCKHCGIRFQTIQPLNDHLLRHTSPQERTCPTCNAKFSNAFEVQVHVRESHFVYENPKNSKCDICSKVFRDVSHLRNHMEVHAGIKKHKCPYCTKACVNFYNLGAHIKKCHPDALYCDKCKVTFQSYAAIRKHSCSTNNESSHQSMDTSSSLVHGEEPVDLHVCTSCNDVFSDFLELSVHSERVHGMTVQYQCSHCKDFFTSYNGLNLHTISGSCIVDNI